jgi:hypothetical protein
MNYDRILSAILMDAKLGLIAASFFMAVGILIAASIVLENAVENLRNKRRERHVRPIRIAPPQPIGAVLHPPIAHA